MLEILWGFSLPQTRGNSMPVTGIMTARMSLRKRANFLHLNQSELRAQWVFGLSPPGSQPGTSQPASMRRKVCKAIKQK